MADTPESNENKKTNISPEELDKLRTGLHKAIDKVDPKLLSILGGVYSQELAGVDVTVCTSKCL